MKKGLAIDGGGLFGVGPAAVLAKCRQPLKFDFLAGTSTGAIIAALVAQGAPPSEIVDFYRYWGPRLFKGRQWRRFKPFTPRYPDKELNKALQSLFPGKFGDLPVPTFIVAADLNRERSKVFTSCNPEHASWDLWEVVRSSAAAETYFMPWKGFGDGGIYANNPSMVAIAGMVHKRGTDLKELELFSIGTGEYTKNTNIGTTWGWTHLQWGIRIMNTLLAGSSNSMQEFFARSLLGDRYHRVNFRRKTGWKMDNPAVICEALNDWRIPILAAAHDLDRFLEDGK